MAHNISRTLLYEMRDQALQALVETLAPQRPGPQPQTNTLVIDQAFVQRAITILPLLPGTVRGVQQGLELLFGVHRSVGYIDQILKKAGAAAEEYNATVAVPLPVLAEADEIFHSGQPCLTVVDGHSFLVLHLEPAEARDGTTWGITFLDLQARGIQFQDLVSDGARGIQAGVREAQLAIPLRHDLFHVVREAHRISQRLERSAYRALEETERARRAEQEASSPKRRRGKPLKVTYPRAQAEALCERAITTYDLWRWLWGEVRQALEPITKDWRLTAAAEVRATILTAAELLIALNHEEVTAFAQKLLLHLSDLVSPLAWLEQHLATWRKELDASTEALILWAWQHRFSLGMEAWEGFPVALQPVVRAFFLALNMFHRSSSTAEALHSWLRPYLQTHNGMPKWLLSLLQLFWNHRPFQRGERAGKSPLELAGVTDVPKFSEVIDQLLNPKPVVQAA
jgi:hypothetical protein